MLINITPKTLLLQIVNSTNMFWQLDQKDPECSWNIFRSNASEPEVIIFQWDGDKISAWHTCEAAKSGYKNGCWHLALAAIIYNFPDLKEIEVISLQISIDSRRSYLWVFGARREISKTRHIS